MLYYKQVTVSMPIAYYGDGDDFDHETYGSPIEDMVPVYDYGTGKTRRESRKAIMLKQKLLGLSLIALGAICAVLDPAEGGAALILCGSLGIATFLKKSPDGVYFRK